VNLENARLPVLSNTVASGHLRESLKAAGLPA
jgi:hypothetical protein